jgi:hypothetical protein
MDLAYQMAVTILLSVLTVLNCLLSMLMVLVFIVMIVANGAVILLPMT